MDSPAAAGGGGRGFSGGQLLHLAVAGCVSNDLFREAAKLGIELTRVVITADGGYSGQPAVSAGISYSVEIEGLATNEDLEPLVRHVDEIAEIPNSLRAGTEVRLGNAVVRSHSQARGGAGPDRRLLRLVSALHEQAQSGCFMLRGRV